MKWSYTVLVCSVLLVLYVKLSAHFLGLIFLGENTLAVVAIICMYKYIFTHSNNKQEVISFTLHMRCGRPIKMLFIVLSRFLVDQYRLWPATVPYWPCLAPTLGSVKTRRYQIRNTRMLSSSTRWIWLPSVPQPLASAHAMALHQAESMNKLYSSMVSISSHLIKLVHGHLDTYP